MTNPPRRVSPRPPVPRAALRALALVGVLATLAGCTFAESQPTNFYLLDPIEPTAARAPEGDVRLAIEPVTIPQYLDRQDIVMRDGESGLQVSGLHQWAEPLDATVTRVLAENLRLLLDATEVVPLPSRRSDFNATLYLELLRFERQTDASVALVAAWTVVAGDGLREIASDRAVIRKPIAETGTIAGGDDYAAVVAAMNAALDELSRHVAGSLRQAGAAR